ncbi:hypothetical protein D3C78_1339950 [compost metagenome]
MGGIELDGAPGVQGDAVFQFERGDPQVVLGLGVLGQEAAAEGELVAEGEELQVVDSLAAEVGQFIAPAVFVARAEAVDVAVAQVEIAQAVIQVQALGGGGEDARGVIGVLGVATDLLAAAQHQFAGIASQASS